MNEVVKKLGDALNQVSVAVQFSTRNNKVGQYTTECAIKRAVEYLNQAQEINAAQERFEENELN